MSLTITSGDSRSAALTSARPSCTRDHVELRLEQAAQQFRGFRVIVGEQQAWVRHGLFGLNGLSLWRCASSAEAETYGATLGETTGAGPKNY